MISTIHSRVELFAGILEEQFQRQTSQLSQLITCSRRPDRGGYDEEILIALTVSARKALADTAAALRRVAEGRYGTCSRCGVSVPLERLQTVPHTAFCLPCQRTRTSCTISPAPRVPRARP